MIRTLIRLLVAVQFALLAPRVVYSRAEPSPVALKQEIRSTFTAFCGGARMIISRLGVRGGPRLR
jgi:hypothetical protein